MMDRKQAFIIIKKYLKSENLIKHSLVTEGILRKIAKTLGTNEDLWGMTGLLYNIDYEYTLEEPEKRGILASQLLDGLLPNSCLNAIKSVNYRYSDYIPSTPLDKSLVAAAALADFIIDSIDQTSLKNISELDTNVLKNKFREASLKNVNLRNRILLCSDVGIDLTDFLDLGLKTVREIYKI